METPAIGKLDPELRALLLRGAVHVPAPQPNTASVFPACCIVAFGLRS